MSIVRQDIIQRIAIFTDGHDLQAKAIKDDTLILLLTEDHLLAMVKYDGAVFTRITLSYALMHTVIEDHTVHQDFDDSSALMLSTCYHTLPEELHIDIQ